MKLSHKLQDISDGNYFDGAALWEAYNLDHTTTENDIRVLSRYMHGAELSSDRFRLQDLAIQLHLIGL